MYKRQLLTLYRKGDFDIGTYNWVFGTGEVCDFYNTVLHTKIGLYGKCNYSGYSNSVFDSLVEFADRSYGKDRHKAILRATEILMRDLPIIPFYECPNLVAIKREIDYSVRLDGRIYGFELGRK